MAVLPILTWPHPCLSTVCAPVGGADVSGLVADMLETMYAAPGRGLAAPQVGASLRVFVMDVSWKDGPPNPLVCIDPEIVVRSDVQALGAEGCLSLPGVLVDVPRATEITLSWTGIDGQRHVETLTGFPAICAQHEYDHLDGIITFDRLTPEARRLAEAVYADRSLA